MDDWSFGSNTSGTTGPPRKRARFVARVNPVEWDSPPTITSIPQIMSCLRQNHVVTGNLIVTADEAVPAEVTQIWQAYELDQAMTVAVVTPGRQVGPTISCWWDSRKAASPPFRYKVISHQISSFNEGPVPRPPQMVQMLQTLPPKLVTLRLLSPQFYRCGIAGVERQDKPSDVIGEFAQTAGVPVAALTGGRWELMKYTHGQILVGHLRVSEELARKVCGVSGLRGLFATVLTKEIRPQVAWLPKPKGFTTEVYFRAALEKSKTENCPLALRQGGGNDIGLVGGDPMKFNPGRRQSWDMYGVPTFWEHRDVHQFLSQEGWKSLEVRNRAKRRGQHVWVFHASPPPFQDKTVDSTWSYANHDNSCHITILRESPKPRKDASSTAVPAPRKKWVAPEFVAHVDDFDSETAINQSESKDDSGKARDRSPRRKPPGGKGKTPDSEASAVDPDLLLLKRAPGWSIKDEGGTGDCGFRSAARCLATWQKKVWDKEETVVSEGCLGSFSSSHHGG